jgi:hypothetical protein
MASARAAELPQLGGGPLLVMNQVVEVELVDLVSVELREAGAHALKQRSQLRLVIGGDQLTRRTTIGLFP